jgi:predicted N-acyltransferase
VNIQIHDSLEAIAEEQWCQLSGTAFPFNSYQFLQALETSGSVGKRTGWHPTYITVVDGDKLLGASYVYIKTNSYGEYIFDWAWADAYQRFGLDYYPKLTSSVPFTPATGPKLLAHPEADPAAIGELLVRAALSLLEQTESSTLHYLFVPESEIPAYEQLGFSIRHTLQFHWHNNGYATFNDFLAQLKRKKRREIKRERQQVRDANLDIRILTGEALTAGHAGLMYELYLTTIDRKSSADYLTREFFTTIFETMPEHVVLILAGKDEKWIAGTLNFRSNDCLYGRYWGATEAVRHLHFELCYYQTVEYAIANKMRLVEAGAQGHHKVQRGFSPSIIYSAHWLGESPLADPIRRFIDDEKEQLRQGIDAQDTFAYQAPTIDDPAC